MSVERETPRVGDVWQSKGSKARVRADKIAPQYTGSSWMNVHWSSVNGSRKGTCGLHNFAASRTLVERDGKPVVAAQPTDRRVIVVFVGGGLKEACTRESLDMARGFADGVERAVGYYGCKAAAYVMPDDAARLREERSAGDVRKALDAAAQALDEFAAIDAAMRG